MTKQVVLRAQDAEAMRAYGQTIGRSLKGGEVIELSSDLGGGKTTFAGGLAKGAGSSDHVSSPTFTISKLYKTPKFTIHHFDFYRLSEPGLIEHELQDVLDDDSAVIVVEWSDVVEHVLPTERLHIQILHQEDDGRVLQMSCPASLAYLLEGLA